MSVIKMTDLELTAQRHRNRVDDPLTDLKDAQEDEDHTRNKD